MTNANQTSGKSTHDELVYAAGLFDGEGCINITMATTRGVTPQYKLQCSLTNTNLDILDWLQERFGGKIYQSSNNRSQLTDYPRTCRSLWWTGTVADAVLRQLEPYVRIKHEQLLNALTFQSAKAERRGRSMPPDLLARQERCYQIARRLSSRSNSPGAILALAEDEGQGHCMWCGEVFTMSELGDHVMAEHTAPIRLPLGNTETVAS